MKYVSFILILLWSLWMLIENGELKPSENLLLYFIGLLSILYTLLNIVILCIDKKL